MLEENPPRVFKEALTFTAFALEEFKARADRDGFQPVILTPHNMEGQENRRFILLNEMATAAGILVVNQYDLIFRQGRRSEEAR